MKSKALKVSIFLLFCALFGAFGLNGQRVSANLSGPLPSRTGAPGELTCSASDCHLGAVNGGSGVLTISGFPANYSPNQEVNITITMAQSGRPLFGFQATIIDDQGRKAGDITATEPSRTQIISNVVSSNLRQYIQHNFNGTSPNGGPNQGQWTFRWKAPAQSVGRIRIFVASNAANGSGDQTGDLIYTTNASTEPAPTIPAVATVSAASFAQGALAAESIVAGFGSALSVNVVIATDVPLPTELDGTQVVVRDSNNIDRNASLFFVAPSQINYLIPAGTAIGEATVSVRRGGNTVGQGTVQIDTVSPGIFTANASGQGVPAAVALRVVGVQQTFETIYTIQNGQAVATPIDLGPAGNDVYLILYGTGARSAGAGTISATIGGTATPILGFAPAPGFFGLDQINVGPLPRALIGRGAVDVVLTVSGKIANTVTINIQ